MSDKMIDSGWFLSVLQACAMQQADQCPSKEQIEKILRSKDPRTQRVARMFWQIVREYDRSMDKGQTGVYSLPSHEICKARGERDARILIASHELVKHLEEAETAIIRQVMCETHPVFIGAHPSEPKP